VCVHGGLWKIRHSPDGSCAARWLLATLISDSLPSGHRKAPMSVIMGGATCCGTTASLMLCGVWALVSFLPVSFVPTVSSAWNGCTVA
jgi:hypothetical protein